ncbi:hypothetical protein L5515_018366 [Caenorhabditis briggsae]|nr:hypothetical protein L5515_018366 [Caenorhabditis briggsae]
MSTDSAFASEQFGDEHENQAKKSDITVKHANVFSSFTPGMSLCELLEKTEIQDRNERVLKEIVEELKALPEDAEPVDVDFIREWIPSRKLAGEEMESENFSAIFVHPTSDSEIANKIGGRQFNECFKTRTYINNTKLNPFLLGKNFAAAHQREICQNRTTGLFDGWKDDLLVKFDEKVKSRPVLKETGEVLLGAPPADLLMEAIDIEHAPAPEIIALLNHNLKSTGLQVDDLRCRSEEILAQIPRELSEETIIDEMTQAIKKSAAALLHISNCAKHFAVYVFFLESAPYRFYQAVVSLSNPAPWSFGLLSFFTNWAKYAKHRKEIGSLTYEPIDDESKNYATMKNDLHDFITKATIQIMTSSCHASLQGIVAEKLLENY